MNITLRTLNMYSLFQLVHDAACELKEDARLFFFRNLSCLVVFFKIYHTEPFWNLFMDDDPPIFSSC